MAQHFPVIILLLKVKLLKIYTKNIYNEIIWIDKSPGNSPDLPTQNADLSKQVIEGYQ